MNGNGSEPLAVASTWTPAERRQTARDAYRAQLAAGRLISGAELGRRFGLSPRWGVDRVAEVRAEDAARNNGGAPTAELHADPTEAPEPPADRHAAGVPVPARRTWQDSAITLVVALVAAAASYGHMLDVALMAGEPVWIARLFPVTVDGLVLAALRRGKGGHRWLALGAAVSIAANVLAQFPDVAVTAGPAVSAWPPLALYGTHRLLQRRT